MKQKVACVIMGGGRGTRLYPLTKTRAKPAVPLGGKYRLVDIPISNCLNSGYNKIYLLTQFNTASLHRHIQDSYKFDPFSAGFVDILSAEQTELGDYWYQGTADAVRQNMHHFHYKNDDLFLILSGDQLYRMDFREIIEHHKRLGADITISSTLIPKERASHFGVIRVGDDFVIKEFVEKPKSNEEIESLVISGHLCSSIGHLCRPGHCLASMGIYVFKASVLKEALQLPGSDFGKEVLPGLLGKAKVCSYVFEGYWEDIGTIGSFLEANLMLTDLVPAFNFFDADNLIYTHPRFLPSSKINGSRMVQTILGDGCIVTDAVLERCVVGVRSVIREGSYLKNVYIMGSEEYEGVKEEEKCNLEQIPLLGVGKNCVIENAIIDKGARIGNKVKLRPNDYPNGYDYGDICIRDGKLVVIRNGIVPDGTVLWRG